MARKAVSKRIPLKQLTKGQQRKLTALRKSLGDEIADRAFAEWLESQPDAVSSTVDRNADVIAKTLTPLVMAGEIKIPRGGYLVRRGRQRVIVELAADPSD